MVHKQRILTLLGLLLLFVAAKAEKGVYIWTVDSSSPIHFLFEQEPTIKFKEQTVCISTKSTMVEISSENLIRFTFDDDSSQLQTVDSDDCPVIKVCNNEIQIYGLIKGTTVNIYNTQGSLVSSGKSDDTGSFSTELYSGYFIIAIENIRFKIKI